MKKKKTFEQQVRDILLSHPEWRKEFKEDLRKGGYPYAIGPLFDKYVRFQNPEKYDRIKKQNEEALAAHAARETQTSVYKGYKQDKIEMRGDRAEMSDFPLYLNTVAGGLDRRDQTIGGFSFVVKIYAVPVIEIIG